MDGDVSSLSGRGRRGWEGGAVPWNSLSTGVPGTTESCVGFSCVSVSVAEVSSTLGDWTCGGGEGLA